MQYTATAKKSQIQARTPLDTPFVTDDTPTLLTVSQLNRKAKSLLESHFGYVWVEGEISNFASPSSGHWYFSLKDRGAQVRCAMFRNSNQRVPFTPKNGDAIKLRCRVSLYEGRGEYQLIVEHLEHAGAGALQAAFEKLKAKLLAEGLFDANRKQALPTKVSHLGVITSQTGAAIHDILTVLERRCPLIKVYLLPVAVQGEGAAGQIVSAIERANRWQREGKIHMDALIVGRGGGSLEDLWAFNEERVARAIAASQLPIISAVGHEVDFSIADMAADHRAPTPSAAAEQLSTDQREWQQRLQASQSELVRLIRRKLADAGTELSHLQQRLKHPGMQMREQAQRLDDLEQRLVQTQKHHLRRRNSDLAVLFSRLQAKSPLTQLQQFQQDLVRWRQRLESATEHQLQLAGSRLSHLSQMLDSLSPLRTLQRGYSIVTNTDGTVIQAASDVSIGDDLTARLAKGQLGLKVTRVD
jgi:exodeoxyribonuclease VII large subunit